MFSVILFGNFEIRLLTKFEAVELLISEYDEIIVFKLFKNLLLLTIFVVS